jgi:hypothetical protein
MVIIIKEHQAGAVTHTTIVGRLFGIKFLDYIETSTGPCTVTKMEVKILGIKVFDHIKTKQ